MAKLTPEQQIRANVAAQLGKRQTTSVKKQNLFVQGMCKSASRTRSTDLAEIEEICASLPVSDATCAALTCVCLHNNTQIREKAIANAGEDPGAITPEQMALATAGEDYTAFDYSMMIVELMACGVLSLIDGFWKVTLYAEE